MENFQTWLTDMLTLQKSLKKKKTFTHNSVPRNTCHRLMKANNNNKKCDGCKNDWELICMCQPIYQQLSHNETTYCLFTKTPLAQSTGPHCISKSSKATPISRVFLSFKLYFFWSGNWLQNLLYVPPMTCQPCVSVHLYQATTFLQRSIFCD